MARSDYYRGMPLWDPVYTVIECATGLVFAKLSYDQVEIVNDAPVTASFTGWA